MPGPTEDLTPPAVDPGEYDTEYYTHSCIGADEWRESSGQEAAGIYPGALTLAKLAPGERVLDVGTGRADLLPVALKMGASRAVGVDYSPSAIELASKTLEAAGNPPEASALLADARRIPVEDSEFDLVTMLDVVEHLTPEELDVTLGEVRRALRPGGRLFIHTAPNALVYRWTYRAQRSLLPSRRREWPVNPRNEHENTMHVNEQTMASMKRTMREAGFRNVTAGLGKWVHTDFLPNEKAKRLYWRLSRVPGLRALGVFDLFAVGVEPD